jgi:hypothetical protein
VKLSGPGQAPYACGVNYDEIYGIPVALRTESVEVQRNAFR